MTEKVRAVAALQFLVLRSSRAEKIVAFYHAVGLEFAEEKHSNGPRHHSCELGGLVLEIYPRGRGDDLQTDITLGFGVASVEDALAALAAAGFASGPFAPPSGAGRLLTANLRDPDGRTVILTSF